MYLICVKTISFESRFEDMSGWGIPIEFNVIDLNINCLTIQMGELAYVYIFCMVHTYIQLYNCEQVCILFLFSLAGF